MKNFKLLYVVLTLLSVFSSSWASERVAPTFPVPVELESGKSYYLYNVGTGKFLSLYSDSYPSVDTYGFAVVPEIQEDGSYALKISNKYIYAQSTTTSSSSSISNQSYFSIAATTGGYTIQRSAANTSYYNADQYLGFVEGTTNNRITPDLTEGNIVWQFMEVEATERYYALHKLYTALEATTGYNFTIDRYETVYNNEESTNEELTEAATTLANAFALTTAYTFPDWNDYPILLENDENNSWTIYDNSQLRLYLVRTTQKTIKLTATVSVDQSSVLVYRPSFNCKEFSVYINGNKVRTIYNDMIMSSSIEYRYFEELSPGTHKIEFAYTNADNDNEFHHEYIYEIGVEKTPTIEVSLLEPGSLGTEVLYNVNHVKDVRRLKIKGKMNSDDWAKIDMMTSLFSLDLSEAEIAEIPENSFSYEHGTKNFFYEIILPKGLTDIGENAFWHASIEKINFPSTLKTIGKSAFRNSTLPKAILPDGMTAIGESAFEECKNLITVSYPKDIKYIPKYCFKWCVKLETFQLHEGLESVEEQAFYAVYNFNPRLPKSLKKIYAHAFQSCKTDSVVFYENMEIGPNVFGYSESLVYAEFPSSYYQSKNSPTPIYNCSNLKTLVFKSPTVVAGYYKDSFLDGCNADVTIKVPSFLVNSYKLDEYWYNYNIEGFNTADIKDWEIYGNVVLNARERMEGTPNINLRGTGTIKINGEDSMDIDSLVIYANGNDTTNTAKFLSKCENISIKGQLTNRYYMTAKKWYFISMPFDFKVGDVTTSVDGAKFVLRYYDGASRAVNGASGNWKDYVEGDVIKAGTGFIAQASVDTELVFTSLDNESKQYVVSNKEFVKALDANVSETAADNGWNLVGNPWQSFYNIHILNFTAPVTIYNVSNKTYTAYSIIDDDIAIEPNQAFFVQCPEDVTSISFPETGRQLTSYIDKQQDAVTASVLSVNNRQLIDLSLNSDGLTDKTRIVLNDRSSMDYETVRDASKFFTPESGVSQIYTIGNEGSQYAINERPEAEGTVNVGVIIAQSGTHTFSLQRNEAKSVILIDLETGISHDLTSSDYVFTAKSGTYNNRFILSIDKNDNTTDVENSLAKQVSIEAVDGGIEISGVKGIVNVYSTIGCNVASLNADGSAATIALEKGIYIVNTTEGSVKVIVK